MARTEQISRSSRSEESTANATALTAHSALMDVSARGKESASVEGASARGDSAETTAPATMILLRAHKMR